MLFIYSKIVRCKKLTLTQGDTLEINYGKKTQIIVGRNGSGKSILTKVLLTPLPIKARWFHSDGYIEHKVFHNGNTYRTVSDYSQKKIHSFFINDGVDLNPGGTETAQASLCLEHFGISQDIHDVCTGSSKFTTMSTDERRKILSKILPTDFTYITKFYERSKKAASSTKSVIEYQSATLASEIKSVLSKDDYQVLLDRKDSLVTALTDLVAMRLDRVNVKAAYDELENHIAREEQVATILQGKLHDSRHFYKDEDDMYRILNETKTIKERIEGSYQTILSEYDELDAKLKTVLEYASLDEDALLSEQSALKTAIDDNTHLLKTGLTIEELTYDTAPISDIYGYVNLAQNLEKPDVKNPTELENKTVQLKERIGQIKLDIQNLSMHIDHMDSVDTVVCPNCNTSFKPDIDMNDIGACKNKKEELEKTLASISKEYNDSYKLLKTCIDYVNVKNELNNYRHKRYNISSFFKFLDKKDITYSKLDIVLAASTYIEDINIVNDILHSAKRLELVNGLLINIEKSNPEKIIYENRLNDLEQKLLAVIDQKKESDKYHAEVKKDVEDRETFTKLYEELMHLHRTFDDKLCKYFDHCLMEELSAYMKELHIELSSVEQQLFDAKSRMDNIEYLKSIISKLEKEHKVYDEITKVLNPKDGLIAKQQAMGINGFIELMNRYLEKAWNYNIRIKPFDVETGYLDYKFEVEFANDGSVSDDVAKTSDSQVDIINTIFTLALYRYGNLKDFPLYIDELGRTFDELHKRNLVPFIKSLISDEFFSQVFFISHIKENYAAIPNSEILSINDSHISIEGPYNEHVLMY